jgi:hypothetical protein
MMRSVHLQDRHPAVDGGVVDEDAKSAEQVDGRIDDLLRRVVILQVDYEPLADDACASERRTELLERRLLDVRDENAGARGPEPRCEPAADAPARTRHDGDLPLEREEIGRRERA